ncbi:unnamed protein product [Urochloa humidicola]
MKGRGSERRKRGREVEEGAGDCEVRLVAQGWGKDLFYSHSPCSEESIDAGKQEDGDDELGKGVASARKMPARTHQGDSINKLKKTILDIDTKRLSWGSAHLPQPPARTPEEGGGRKLRGARGRCSRGLFCGGDRDQVQSL